MRNVTPIIVLLLVAVLVYFVYKKFSGFTFAWGDQGGGHGPGGEAASAADMSNGEDKNNTGNGTPINTTGQTGEGKKPAIIPRKVPALDPAHKVIHLPELLKPILSPILGKMPDKKLPNNPLVQGLAKQLAAANKDAAKFKKAFGTTPVINKAFAAVKYISDDEFTQTIQTWKAIDHFASPLDTDLCGAMVGGEQSNFLTRLTVLKLV